MDGEESDGPPDRAATRLVGELWHFKIKMLSFWLPQMSCKIDFERGIIDKLLAKVIISTARLVRELLKPAC